MNLNERTIQEEAKEIFQDFFEGICDFFATCDVDLMDAIERHFILSCMDYTKTVKYQFKHTVYTISLT
jgi:hypothetical protein